MPSLTDEIRKGRTITEIAGASGVSRNTIHSRMRAAGLNHQQLKFNHNFFEIVDCEEKAYWLGFIMADGCVSMTQSPKIIIGLHKRDLSHLRKWHKILGSCVKIHRHRDRVASTHYSPKMCKDLIRMGCTPRKSLKLKFPLIRNDLVRHFVRGYFDGDGCISWHNKNQKTPQVRFTIVGTKAFLDRLQIILGTNNQYSGQSKAYGLLVTGNKKARNILDWMYGGATISLDRKREIYDSSL